jgi:CheY-like chemotaxis protein
MRAARESTAHSGRRRELVIPILTDLQTANEKPTALVVDDSTDIAIMLVMILQHAGYDAVMSISAPEALKLAHTQHFDLVVSDIGMPEMDGYSLVRALRSIPEYQDVPLVAVTGFDQYDDRERALAAGFNTHVRKPIHPEMFMELIEKFRSQ